MSSPSKSSDTLPLPFECSQHPGLQTVNAIGPAALCLVDSDGACVFRTFCSRGGPEHPLDISLEVASIVYGLNLAAALRAKGVAFHKA